jgi:hypothetical protein
MSDHLLRPHPHIDDLPSRRQDRFVVSDRVVTTAETHH